MEQTASCGDRRYFDRLADAYRCLLAGSCPRQSTAEVALVIFSGVCGPRAPAEHCHDSVELTCISVSLVHRITSRLTTHSLPPETALYCGEILRLLFQDMDLMSQLVHQFQAEDQIISHLAAKSVSAWVFHHLHTAGVVSPIWEQKCVQAFHSSPPGAELDSCLWSLTEVLERLLRGAHQEVLGKVLAAFDGSLMALFSRFLSEERTEPVQCSSSSSSSHWGTTFCLLLDLLEVLTASSLTCAAAVCLKSQRIAYIWSSALLTTVGCSSEYFIRKRALLLLKRTVLQRVGEDRALLSAELEHKHLGAERSLLAHSVLTAVAAKWLQSVEVESASFFGGTRHLRAHEGQKADCVMLRAVSLLLLKSMEFHVQTAGGAAGVDSAAEVHGYLQSLWGFLSRCSVQLTEVTHRCCWVSLLFGEQDDDMMEAAKALLSIFLHHRRYSGLDDSTVLGAACASGCNPHCHFVLLLQSISFDHSLLLDFLISTETCFLEYFVRYLRYLRADWPGFAAACGRVGVSDCHLSLQQTLASRSSDARDVFASRSEPRGAELSSCVQPTGVSAAEVIGLAAGLRLVDYGSSDESDPEKMEDSQDQPEMSVCDKGRSGALDVSQEISGAPVPATQKLSEANSTLERPSPQGLHGEQTWCPSRTPVSGQVTCEAAARAARCLSELRQVVMRLQTKRLFPYNPSSLIRLLEQVEDCSQQSHVSRLNKP